MPEFAPAPAASEFPEVFTRMETLVDTVIIKQYADVKIAQLKNYFGYALTSGSQQYVGDGFYDQSREINYYIDFAIGTKNPMAVAQIIRMVHDIESIEVRPEKVDEYNIKRPSLNFDLQRLFDSQT